MFCYPFTLAVAGALAVLPPAARDQRGRAGAAPSPLPAGALARVGDPRLRQRGPVQALAFLPGGRALASLDDAGDFHLWDAATGAATRRLLLKQENAVAAFSPDGRLRAVADGEGGVRLWDTGAGKELRRLAEKGLAVAALAFAPDGKALAAG